MTKQERDRRITDNIKLAYKCAHRYCSLANQRDDAIAVALLSLVRAADRFEDRGVCSFSTFAWWAMKGAIIDHIRKATNYTRHGSRRKYVKVDIVGADMLDSVSVNDEPADPWLEKHVRDVVDNLPRLEKASMMGLHDIRYRSNRTRVKYKLRARLAPFTKDYLARRATMH